MTEPSFDYDDLDKPLNLRDYVEIVSDTLDEAVDGLEHGEVELLCTVVRAKVSAILKERCMWRPDDRSASDDDRDPNNRWWDRP
jgi:hypothetical protein